VTGVNYTALALMPAARAVGYPKLDMLKLTIFQGYDYYPKPSALYMPQLVNEVSHTAF
jgi:hypothetical protein